MPAGHFLGEVKDHLQLLVLYQGKQQAQVGILGLAARWKVSAHLANVQVSSLLAGAPQLAGGQLLDWGQKELDVQLSEGSVPLLGSLLLYLVSALIKGALGAEDLSAFHQTGDKMHKKDMLLHPNRLAGGGLLVHARSSVSILKQGMFILSPLPSALLSFPYRLCRCLLMMTTS